MQTSKLSLLVITALAALAAQSHAAVVSPENGAIGLVENNSYGNGEFIPPKNGVILGKDSIGTGNNENAVIVGNNSVIGSTNNILVGSNSTNNAINNSTVIGSNSHAGALLRWKGADGKLHWGKSEGPSNVTIVGNNTSVNDKANVMALGNEVTINGSYSLALGNKSQAGSGATALGMGSKANAEGSVAIGAASAADRKAYDYGYNAATGQAYTFDDLKDSLEQEDLEALKTLDKRRIELEQAIAERKQQSDAAKKKMADIDKKMATTIFNTPEEKEAFLKEYEAVSNEHQKAYNAYVGAPEYTELGKVKTEMRTKAESAALSIQGNSGAVSVGYDNWTTRQVTNVAAGSADTDAVNVKQLKDYATATNAKIEATEERLTTAEGTIAEHGKTLESHTKELEDHTNKLEKLNNPSETNEQAIKDLNKSKVDKTDYELDKKNFGEKLDKEINDRKADSKIFGERLTTAEGTIAEHGKTLESHTKELEDHTNKLEKLDDRSETNKEAIKNLKQNKVDKADYELDKKNFDEKLDKEIDERKADSKIFNKRTKDNQKNIEANKQAIVQTNDKVDVIDNRVKAAEGSIVEHGKTLESHTKELEDHTNKLTTISATVERHTGEIDELKKLHSSGMQNINNRINKMDKKFERGLAANAALAGLMQPYNIKKFNVTVGMGGYRSATAIAAGAGYRFSNSVAVRAGLATDTQDFSNLTYNMSASFEF